MTIDMLLYFIKKIFFFFHFHKLRLNWLLHFVRNRPLLILLSGYISITLFRYYCRKPYKLIPFINRRLTKATLEIKDKCNNEMTLLDNKIKESINIDTQILPMDGLNADIIQKYIDTIKESDTTYKLISGCVYDDTTNNQHADIMMRSYEQFAYSNPMHGDIYNSVVFMERNMISMIGNLLQHSNPCGTITNGGTESLFLAIKTYRDLKTVDTSYPNLVVPDTIHCSIDKLCHYLKVKVIKVPTDTEHRVSSTTLLSYVDRHTIAVILSAPSYGFGIMDDVATIGPLLFSRDIPLHVDACLGGFVWMFLENGIREKYGFHIQGVTSISVCLHKYGYSQKGVSSIIYRDERLLKSQYFATNDWDGGFYVSPSFLGSRSGGLVAQAWAGMLSRGYNTYKTNASKIMDLAVYTYCCLSKIEQLTMFPRDLHIVAFSFGSKTYQLYDYLTERGFLLNALQHPPAIHICLTLTHSKERIDELCSEIVSFVSSDTTIVVAVEGIAPIYGMRAGIPIYANEIVNACLKLYLSSKYSNHKKQ
jgi:sphinganine-1-phosphate aldolase